MTTGESDIRAACHEAGVDPVTLLHVLFEGLESRHRTYRQTFADVGPDAGLFVEVSDLIAASGGDGGETPKSLLAAIELHLRLRADRERADAALQVVATVAKGYLMKAEH